MRKITILLALLLFAGLQGAFAQKTITGKITSADDGLGMVGVPVVVKGTTIGTATDIDGAFSLNVPADATTLVVSFIGMKTVEMPIGSQTVFNIVLESDMKALGDVVVTALGIQREKKTLTYASQQVDAAEMMKTKDINFMSGLSGKTAGLEIKKNSSGAGGSTRTVLRGSKSLNSLSEPLYVIDGIPMANHKGGQASMWGGTDQGDGLSQINNDDIESISILKGSNAAVLYGSQGANGVVIITTKKGKEGKTDVSFSSSTIFESVMTMPKLQYKYGSIVNEDKTFTKESWSYTPGNYDDTFVEDFFRTGHNVVNSLSISGGNEKTTAYFSYSNTTATGIVPTNSYDKNNVTFKQSTKLLNNKLTINSNVMLSSEKTHNRNAAGYYLNPLTGLYFFPRDQNFDSYKNEYSVWNAKRNMYLQNWFVSDHQQSNPYWILNREPKDDYVKRLIASVGAEYEITKHLKFQARASYDYANKVYDEKDFAGSNGTNVSENGRWVYQKYNDELMYTDGMFTYNNKFGDFSLDALVGASYQRSIYGDGVYVNNGLNNLFYANEFNFQNLPTNVQVQSTLSSRAIKEGVYGNATLGYKEMLFLDFSGRNDWASTLYGTGNDSYFYPSVGLTGIVSQMVSLPDFISFAKVRGSYSTVANEVPWNVVNPMHSINASGGVERNTYMPFTGLKPEMIKSSELGTEWRFMEGRFGFDFTYYNIVSTDQFITLSAPSGSGYSYYYINAGKIVNQGVEITANAEVVNASDFSWNTTFNFTKNVNEVKELIASDPDYTVDYGSSEGYHTLIKAGGSFGDIYGLKFARNDEGKVKIDQKTGAPLKTDKYLEGYLGNLEPDWSLGWNNNFKYKNFSLGMLINAKIGGKCVSQTESMLDGYGVSERTADARDMGYVKVDGVYYNGDVEGAAVTEVDPKSWFTTTGDRNGILEPYVYDRTNIRLQQLALSYDLDVKKLSLPFKAASISLVGNNLFFLYKKAPYDPELTMSTDMNSQGLDNFNLPATRTYGFNVKINF